MNFAWTFYCPGFSRMSGRAHFSQTIESPQSWLLCNSSVCMFLLGLFRTDGMWNSRTWARTGLNHCTVPKQRQHFSRNPKFMAPRNGKRQRFTTPHFVCALVLHNVRSKWNQTPKGLMETMNISTRCFRSLQILRRWQLAATDKILCICSWNDYFSMRHSPSIAVVFVANDSNISNP